VLTYRRPAYITTTDHFFIVGGNKKLRPSAILEQNGAIPDSDQNNKGLGRSMTLPPFTFEYQLNNLNINQGRMNIN